MKRRGVRHRHCDARVKTKKMKRTNKGKGEKREVMRIEERSRSPHVIS
jgi:hypothetical protein